MVDSLQFHVKMTALKKVYLIASSSSSSSSSSAFPARSLDVTLFLSNLLSKLIHIRSHGWCILGMLLLLMYTSRM